MNRWFCPLLVLPLSVAVFYFSDLVLSLRQLLLVACLSICVFWSFFRHDPSLKLPPGPLQIPFFGTIQLLFTKERNDFISKLHVKFGPIVAVSIGQHHVFQISGYELMKELSVHPDFQLRPRATLFAKANKNLGLISSEGELWKHQRRFVLHSLKDSGMGRLGMQEKIGDELSHVIKIIRDSNSCPITIHELLEKATANILFSLAFSKQFDYDDEDFIARIRALDQNLKLFAKIGALSSFKCLKPFLGNLRQRIFDNVQTMKKQSQEFIDEHLQNLDKDNPRDLLDLYLIEMDNKEEDNDGYRKTFFMEQLKYLIIDLFAGGTETSSTTIRWAILYMIHYPEVQEKVKKELDEVVGTERNPGLQDKSQLPYTVATLQEIERLGSAVPSSLPRSNDKPVQFHGYVFPRRSIIRFSLYTIHRDPELWKHPDTFNPSRFIDSEGKVFRPPHLAPFGSGKRACPGEALARTEIFIFFATLMQNFRFEAPKSEPLPPLTSPPGVIRAPHIYKVCCMPYDR